MIFNKFMQEFAREIKGQFSEYDQKKSVIIVPLGEKRFQAVLGFVKTNPKNNRQEIVFSSKVCTLRPDIKLEELLRRNASFCYARFSIFEDDLLVEASTYFNVVTEPLMKDIIMEVAGIADEWEYKFTGQDKH